MADEARALLKGDAPPSVKTALLLSCRGGRQQKRRCRTCGRPAQNIKLWTADVAWRVDSNGAPPPVQYWLCAQHWQEEEAAQSGPIIEGQQRR